MLRLFAGKFGNRDAIVVSTTSSLERNTASRATKAAFEFLDSSLVEASSNSPNGLSSSEDDTSFWCSRPVNIIKVNFDGAWSKEDGSMGKRSFMDPFYQILPINKSEFLKFDPISKVEFVDW